jgi:DNA-binding MarR family transcriptional regulator
VDEEAVDALLLASRALVGVAARSLADVDAVTLPQFRALVLVSSRPRTTVSDLAQALGIHPTSATRLCDRLVRKRMIRRAEAVADRRQTELHLAAAGRRLVAHVTDRRRDALRLVAARMGPEDRAAAVQGLRAFAVAAEESADEADLFGWEPSA